MTEDAPPEPEPWADGSVRKPESAGCALGTSAGLLITLGLVAGLMLAGRAAREPETVLAEAFTWEALPFGLELVEANRTREGAELVRLAHPDYRDEIPLPVVAEPEPTDEPTEEQDEARGEAGPQDAAGPPEGEEQAPPGNERIVAEERKHWLAIVEPVATDSPPVEVIFAFYPEAERVAALFRGRTRWGGGGMREIQRGPEGVHREVTREVLTWGDYQANYVLERVHLPERHFRDSLRVNLSHEGTYCVLFAEWPVDHKGNAGRVEELLGAFRPLETE